MTVEEHQPWRKCIASTRSSSGPKQDDFWLNIGVAFPHEKGDGFNVVLQALPLHGNGKLVMRAYDPEAPVASEGETLAELGTPRADA